MTTFTDLIAQRGQIEDTIERGAVLQVRDWLVAHQLTHIAVDDANEHPAYGYDSDGNIIEDDELNYAISWIPNELLHNPTHPAWNPIIRVQDLNEFLTLVQEQDRRQSGVSGGQIWIEFDDGGGARWSGISESDIDKVCAFIEAIKQPDTVT